MAVAEIMKELESYGNEGTKRVLLKHGIKEPFFGVKIEHLKTIVKRVKMDYNLSKELFATGNADAMYLAGLIADDAKMTKEDLQTWVKMAVSQNISEYTVPWVAAGSRFGFELALEWIDAKEERTGFESAEKPYRPHKKPNTQRQKQRKIYHGRFFISGWCVCATFNTRCCRCGNGYRPHNGRHERDGLQSAQPYAIHTKSD
jgi:hypothetical protein